MQLSSNLAFSRAAKFCDFKLILKGFVLKTSHISVGRCFSSCRDKAGRKLNFHWDHFEICVVSFLSIFSIFNICKLINQFFNVPWFQISRLQRQKISLNALLSRIPVDKHAQGIRSPGD